ncbi:MAG TPA: DsbA family protein [Candidatus Binatia bacterium]
MDKRWIAIAAAAIVACSQQPSSDEAKQSPTSQPAAATAAAPAPAANAPAAAPAGGTAALDKSKITELIKRYYINSGQIPPDVNMEVTELKPSQVTGLTDGTLHLSRGAQSQDVPFLITSDGRWFLRTDPVDLTVDPVQDVISKIDTGPDNPRLGPADAKVTIVEYSDFQCPFCARAEEIVQGEVLKEYGDKVTFIYKQFPLTSIHPWAEPASVMGLCVYKLAGNDAYWKYHAAVFKAQKEIPNEDPDAKLLELAKEAGADEAKVKACYDAGETKPIVEATLAEAEAIGVNSTPTFFINGRRLSGAQSLDAFKALIDPELQAGS